MDHDGTTACKRCGMRSHWPGWADECYMPRQYTPTGKLYATKTVQQRCVELYEAGVATDVIAAELGKTPRWVGDTARRRGARRTAEQRLAIRQANGRAIHERNNIVISGTYAIDADPAEAEGESEAGEQATGVRDTG